MSKLDLTGLETPLLPTGAWATALLESIAREEVLGRRPARVTEPGLATWKRFHGRLTSTDLLTLLFEDAAVLYPVPFDAGRAPVRPGDLRAETAQAWLDRLPELPLKRPGPEYVADQARRFGLPTRFGRSELHVVKPHHRVLELPGAGGQLSHHLVTQSPELKLQDSFTIACGTWQERTLAGLVAVELGAPRSDFVLAVTPAELQSPEHPLRKRTFDFVVGLLPEKGGAFEIADQLAIWFPTATKLLV